MRRQPVAAALLTLAFAAAPVWAQSSPATPRVDKREAIQTELMSIRFTARTVERLCDTLRSQVDEVRKIERAILHIIVDKCGMPRADFVSRFPGNETDLNWVHSVVADGKPYSGDFEEKPEPKK